MTESTAQTALRQNDYIDPWIEIVHLCPSMN